MSLPRISVVGPFDTTSSRIVRPTKNPIGPATRFSSFPLLALRSDVLARSAAVLIVGVVVCCQPSNSFAQRAFRSDSEHEVPSRENRVQKPGDEWPASDPASHIPDKKDGAGSIFDRKLARDDVFGGWTPSEPFRRAPRSTPNAFAERHETSELVQAAEPTVESDIPETNQTSIAVGQESLADAPAIDFNGPASQLSSPVLDVRVHDFNTNTSDSVGHTDSFLSQTVVCLISILVAGLIGGSLLLGCLSAWLRRFGPRVNIVLRIELNDRRSKAADLASAHSPPIRLASISANDVDRPLNPHDGGDAAAA